MQTSEKKVPSGMLDVIPQVKSTETVNWEYVPKVSKKLKKVEEWNKRDTIIHFYDLYYKRYGRDIVGPKPWCALYGSLEKIRETLSIRLNVDVDNLLLKEYFEWYFDTQADNVIKKKRELTFFYMESIKTLLIFTDYKKSIVKGEIKSVKADIKSEFRIDLEYMDLSFGIGVQYFITNYGLVLPWIYLVRVKKKNETESFDIIKKAFDKLCKKNSDVKETIIDITHEFGSYPLWFGLPSFKEMGIDNLEIDENPAYDFLKGI